VKALGVVDAKMKIRSSIRLPSKVVDRIRASMEKGEYSKRDRSKWITEAITKLASEEKYWELIAEEFMDPKENELIPITLNKKTISLVGEMIEGCGRNIGLAVDQSDVIRTSINYRLILEGGGLVI